MDDFAYPDIERAEALLRPIMPGRFSVTYEPAMPGSDDSLLRWFQVVLAVGPGESAILRTQIHELFQRMLASLSALVLVTEADHVTLRVRRFIPDSKLSPDRPFMFIEADWTGSAVRQMRERGDFSCWPSECLTYRNHFDREDTFSKQVIA